MIRHRFVYLVLSVCMICTALTAVGCSDFLDKQPTGSISDANFWMGESDAKLALVGCYRTQNGWIYYGDFATSLGLLSLDLAGGNGVEKENTTTLGMASSSTVATSGCIENFWDNPYMQIANCNTFLDHIGNCPMDDTKKKLWAEEVKVIRAYYLFNLAFYFKDIPMPLTTLTVEEANTIGQTPQAEVYTQVESDLKEAIPTLLDKQPSEDYGRHTKGSARMLLSRVYLAQDRWADAAAVLKEVVDSKLYQLDRRNGDDSYEKLFHVGGEYSPEMIWFIPGAENLYTSSLYQYMYPEGCYGGWHQWIPYNELVRSYFCADGKDIETSAMYDDDDPYANREIRLYASIFMPPLGSFPGSKFNDITYDCFNGPGSSDYYNKYALFNGYSIKKGCDPSITTNLGGTPTYMPVMRYAETLLTYLEAVNEATPNAVNQELLDLTINDIRNRVNLPPYTSAELSSQELVRQAVRKERRVELAFEGFRYFDVLRWGTAMTELNHTFTGVKLSDDPNARNYRGSGSTASPVDNNMYYQFETRTWDSHNRYFPIPQNDLNINKNLKQNEGYN